MTTEEIASKCVDEIHERISPTSRLFVAITGDSGSGKSYYSQLIRNVLEQREIKHTYVNADDFLIARSDREPMKTDYYEEGEYKGKSKWEILENMFRLDELSRVIDELRDKGESSYCPYRRETGTVSVKKVTVEARDLVVFDTSMLLSKMDYVVMIDVEMDTIIKRKIVRDADIRTPEQVEEMHRKVQGYYWQRMKPKNPNIIIDNNDFDNPRMFVR